MSVGHFYDNGYKKAYFKCDNCGNGGAFFWQDYGGFDIPAGIGSDGEKLVAHKQTRPGLQIGRCAICGKKLGDNNVVTKEGWLLT